MKKTMFALAAAATIGLGTLAAPQQAEARCYGCGVGLGILGGVAAGAIIGSAIASHPGATDGYEYDDAPGLRSPGARLLGAPPHVRWRRQLRRLEPAALVLPLIA